ncbi:hypothetical protein AVEN_71198-1 [Araneus ventricosus]|uniref:Uncharacterized protein n=1 Tax=Araneus ventricosus TaxID=182803 RepID=A0A4Y2HRF1_ARAVE|nr:hypothetical protein AVEN_71198-1 [Araneus ventricosus]
MVTRRTGSTPSLPKHPGHLNDSRCNSSSTETGVLITYHQATARALPKEVRTITGGGTQSPTITIPQCPLTYPAVVTIVFHDFSSHEIEADPFKIYSLNHQWRLDGHCGDAGPLLFSVYKFNH